MIELKENQHYLGSLCKRYHDWNNTGKSLRYSNSRYCIECRAFTSKQYAQTEIGKESLRSAIKKFNSTEKRKNWTRNWRKSESGKISLQIAQDKYRQSENGKLIRRKAEIKYANTEKRKISYNRKHARRRALKKTNHQPYSIEDVNKLFAVFNYSCSYCGNSDKKLTLDHFTALSVGGIDAITNLVPACVSCNSSKQKAKAENWYRKQKFFDQNRWQKILDYVRQT